MTVLTSKMKFAIGAVFCCLALFFAAGGALVWAQGYDGRMGPNTFVGPVDVSGLDREAAHAKVQDAADAAVNAGAAVTLNGTQSRVPLSVLVGSDAIEAVVFDADASVNDAYAMTHDGNALVATGKLLRSLIWKNRTVAAVRLDEETLKNTVRTALPGNETNFQNATFAISRSADAPTSWDVTAMEGSDGVVFDFDPFFAALAEHLSRFDGAAIPLSTVHLNPELTQEQAATLVPDVLAALGRAPITLSYGKKEWPVTADDLAKMLVPGFEMGPVLEIDPAAFSTFLADVAADIESPARDAKFSIANGRVREFVSSENGLSINRDELRSKLEAAVRGETEATVEIPADVLEPSVKTADVNDLGITEVLGVGTSQWNGSPANRITNIKNGVRLLNGLLIAPDETFSLLNVLKPFETDNGYLPELVIKGDKITPEVGGGLCQIGTTTFRAALNSGLPIVARSNHSLVVSYYNDPSNGNPGTDATIYDPAPDLKFKNDTGHDVLFQAEFLEESHELRFTFWGTSDGRRGSYSPPVVSRWIPAPDPVETETLDLPPGEKKCQAVHVGADASFVYTVVNADGTVTNETFESHYRPLPQICLVGVAELSTPEDLQAPTDSVSSTQATDTPVTDDASPTVDPTKTE